MSERKGVSVSERDRIVAALKELIEALDRRVAHVERLGEVRIAHEAAALREEAANRIEELRAAESPDTRERERATGVMADEGGPVGKAD